MIVMTAGTGGTLSGIARKIKERVPSCKVCMPGPQNSTAKLDTLLLTVR